MTDKIDFRKMGYCETHELPGGFSVDTGNIPPFGPMCDASVYAPEGYYFAQVGTHVVAVGSAAEARDEMAHIAPCSDGRCNRDCE